jgi:hypothetical protein
MKIVVSKEQLTQIPIPKAVYKAVYKQHKKKESEAGNPTLWVTFSILSQGPGEMNTVGKSVTDNITFSEDSMWRANDLYKAATGSDMVIGAIRDVELALTVTIDTYKGQNRNKIEAFAAVEA